MAKKPGKKAPIRRGQRRRESPTSKFITDEEQAAINEWMKTNEVEVLEPVDPNAPPEEESEDES
ncbi:hypothetical protein [Salipiger mucosus]|uniref:Uncharacterized protein n=1 Tax=Salipiger mucosus DSM 16094 TaxID=1123237 RepID=S9S1E3_9RHOB|nr:hypothetical protein [Salipiger mucosus]EPX84025.1 hypothetical protein Salmuc_01800 [Salipiger mucosus DSM 16094]